MKKLIIILLVLALAGPSIAYCGCCPPVSQLQSSGSQISKVQHDCCQTFETKKDICVIDNANEAPPTIQSFPLAVSSVISNYVFRVFNSDSFSSSPPSFQADVPLYLANQVFRI